MINNREALVWLNYLFVQNKQILNLIEYFGDIKEIFSCDRKEIENSAILSEEKIDFIMSSRDEDKIKKIFKEYENFGAHIITIFDDEYPKRLSNVDDAPAVLYVKGEILPQDELEMLCYIVRLIGFSHIVYKDILAFCIAISTQLPTAFLPYFHTQQKVAVLRNQWH